jgi:hypothetical protein
MDSSFSSSECCQGLGFWEEEDGVKTKDFHLGDILSITTGRLVSPRHIGGVYDILNWMTGEELFTHQLPRVSKEAVPILERLYPWLPMIDDAFECDDWEAWLAEQVAKYGEMHAVPRMTANEHERIDPLSELAEHVHPDRIVIIPNASAGR